VGKCGSTSLEWLVTLRMRASCKRSMTFAMAYIDITGDMLRPVTGHPGPAHWHLTCYCH
jgi:hypothetical protein